MGDAAQRVLVHRLGLVDAGMRQLKRKKYRCRHQFFFNKEDAELYAERQARFAVPVHVEFILCSDCGRYRLKGNPKWKNWQNNPQK